MAIRDALKKAAGLFVEIEETPAAPEKSGLSFEELIEKSAPKEEPKPAATPKPAEVKTIEQIVKDAPGPNLDEIKVEAHASPRPTAPGGDVDFHEIYTNAKLPACPFTAEQALDMIQALPADLPLDAKRATVRVTMSAMGQATGVSAESVVTDASRKLAALASYADGLMRRTNDFVAASQIEISQLEEKIREHRRTIDETKSLLEKAVASCNRESDRLDDILEFFSLDIGPSKFANPKSTSPTPDKPE